MKIGCHISIRNGYLAAAKQAVNMEASAYQYFPKNPRSLSVKTIDYHDAEQCARFCAERDIISIAHTPYPTNLSVEGGEMRKATYHSLLNDLEIVEACGSLGLVVHFGKSKDANPLDGYKRMIELLNEVLEKWKGKALLLIENNAGQGTTMGTTLEEMVQVRRLTEHAQKIGFCLDTCHAFASGLWNGADWQTVADLGEQLGFFAHLKAVHLNDSRYPTGSYRDRHANIGQGYIGEMPFQSLIQSKVIRDIPFILETPSSEQYTHKDEIEYVKGLFREG